MKIDHNTGNYVPYSFRIVCGFFNVPQSYNYTLHQQSGPKDLITVTVEPLHDGHLGAGQKKVTVVKRCLLLGGRVVI